MTPIDQASSFWQSGSGPTFLAVIEALWMNTVDHPQTEFEVIADRIVDDFLAYARSNIPMLSDDAISRAGIYEDHPC